MLWSRPRSIRSLLLWQLGVLFAAGMVALYLAASSYARFASDSSFDRLLLGSAGSILETLSITPTEVRADIPYAALDMLAAAPDDRVFYRVIGTEGATVTGYEDLPADWRRDGSGEDSGAPRFFDASYRGQRARFVVLGREVRVGAKSGWVWVQVGQTREARALLADELTIRALLPILAMTVLAVLVVAGSVRQAVKPLERAGEDLVSRNAADLSPIKSPVPSEVAPLIGAVNQFMARLGSNMEVLRTFIADAAHQLRTPLTTLLVQIRSAETNRGKVRDASLAAARDSATRLARLVEQILGEAMVAHRAQAQYAVPFDLKRLIETSLQDSLSIIDEADVRFTTDLRAAPMIGDDVMVAEAIKNLLHNALAHGVPEASDQDQRIEVFLRRVGTDNEVTIRDNGPGMSEEALRAVGERFSERSRARGGVGLGLAIVQRVAQAHGGALHLSNRADLPGLRAVLLLPSA